MTFAMWLINNNHVAPCQAGSMAYTHLFVRVVVMDKLTQKQRRYIGRIIT